MYGSLFASHHDNYSVAWLLLPSAGTVYYWHIRVLWEAEICPVPFAFAIPALTHSLGLFYYLSHHNVARRPRRPSPFRCACACCNLPKYLHRPLRPFKSQVVAPSKPKLSDGPHRPTILRRTWSRPAELHLQWHLFDIHVSALTYSSLHQCCEGFAYYVKNPHRSFGAVVEVLDISCLVGSYFFDTIQTYAYDIWTNMSPGETTQDLIKKLGTDPLVLGQHYFVGNSTSLHPVWDFRANVEQGNAAGYILAEVVGDIPAPTGPNDVDWLQLKKVEGELADAVYRVDTKGGQPPASVSRVDFSTPRFGQHHSIYVYLQCKPGDSMVSVKFTTKYCERRTVKICPCWISLIKYACDFRRAFRWILNHEICPPVGLWCCGVYLLLRYRPFIYHFIYCHVPNLCLVSRLFLFFGHQASRRYLIGTEARLNTIVWRLIAIKYPLSLPPLVPSTDHALCALWICPTPPSHSEL